MPQGKATAAPNSNDKYTALMLGICRKAITIATNNHPRLFTYYRYHTSETSFVCPASSFQARSSHVHVLVTAQGGR
jgi:hypothetical protein